MAKTIDLTDKLGLGGKPCIVIKGKKFHVNNGAKVGLQLMALIGDGGGITNQGMVQAISLLLGEDGVDKLDAMGLSFEDFQVVVSSALELVIGGAEGEEETQATT